MVTFGFPYCRRNGRLSGASSGEHSILSPGFGKKRVGLSEREYAGECVKNEKHQACFRVFLNGMVITP